MASVHSHKKESDKALWVQRRGTSEKMDARIFDKPPKTREVTSTDKRAAISSFSFRSRRGAFDMAISHYTTHQGRVCQRTSHRVSRIM